jgi:GT2 family glycosyltransferase
MKPVCDIIVLTYNQVETSKKFFCSLLTSTSLPISVIIVDNASSDGTKEYLKTLKDTESCKFRLIFNDKNKGFITGANQGLAVSDAPYVCFANNDLIFGKGWLDEILSIFNKYGQLGILNPSSNSLGVDRNIDISRFSGRFIEMPFCSGFCMVIKREVLNRLGGFSEEYAPMFFEDSDLSMRAIKAGYLIGNAKGSYVWHKEHGSFRNKSATSDKIFRKNRYTFQRKWGKILRIAWIEDNYQGLLEHLNQGVSLARQANFVTFYSRKIKVERENIFKEKNMFEHSGVQFKIYNYNISLVWNILIKKKRFDLIISKIWFFNFIFRVFNYRTAKHLDNLLITKIKRA